MIHRALHLSALALLLLISHTASAALVHSVDINVGGISYLAKFHDFSTSRSFNSLWDSNANGDFTDDGDTFDFLPTFWIDPIGAQEAQSEIIAALGTQDWVDETSLQSDAFVIPTETLGSPGSVTYYYEWGWPVGFEDPRSYTLSRTGGVFDFRAWVTFEAQVPAPSTVYIFVAGLVVLLRSRRNRLV